MKIDAADTIYHITPIHMYRSAMFSGIYRGDTLDTQGFIHCSMRHQVIPVAEVWFRGQCNLLLLEIDVSGLNSEVRYETAPDGGEFPHIYGPLNLNAVKKVWTFEPDVQGHFHFPAEEWTP